MTTSTDLGRPASALDAATVAAISDRLGEPDWLRQRRASWWARMEATPWPSGLEEEWRRTSLAELPRDAALATDPPSIRCVLDPDLADAGVVFSDLRLAVRDHPELVQRHLGETTTLASHEHFWALAQAAWTGGTFLYVPAGVTIERPLTAHLAQPGGGTAYFPLTLVVAERGSSVTLMEEVASPDGEASWF
ncbi:MAG TPA: Fe-S cluster assembly protein SufD, partial [Candidatus Dormibacteraeota bacterium]|nr:Fe-S cluster assembly protein SufD [Candidatus Dormibacteraeota bacterium]